MHYCAGQGCCCYLFFFSSRRRHTRLQGDWSSDVCSSDLFTCQRQPGISVHLDSSDNNEPWVWASRHSLEFGFKRPSENLGSLRPTAPISQKPFAPPTPPKARCGKLAPGSVRVTRHSEILKADR